MKFYRYTAVQYASHDMDGELCASSFPSPTIVVSEYNLHKETPKGYWIGHGYLRPGKLRGQSRWVSKTARKRFAYPTKEEALNNFVKRTKRRLEILEYQAQFCESAISMAKQMQLKMNV